jgi:hypothetical protein
MSCWNFEILAIERIKVIKFLSNDMATDAQIPMQEHNFFKVNMASLEINNFTIMDFY